MPNRRKFKKVRGGPRRSGRADHVECVSGKAQFTINNVPNGVGCTTVHPSFPFSTISGTNNSVDVGVTKLQAMSVLFRYYRCTRLVHRWLSILPYTTLTGQTEIGTVGLVGSYLGGDTPNADAPVTPDEVMEQPYQVKAQSATWSVATSSIGVVTYLPSEPKTNVVPRSMLFGRQPLKWWLCETDMTTAVAPGMMVYQGQFFHAPYTLGHVGTGDFNAIVYAFELEYTFEFTEFQAHPTGMLTRGLKQKQIQEEESDEKSDDEVELDDASLMIIAANSTGLGAQADKRLAESVRLKQAIDQARWDEAIARAKISRLETKLKETSPEKVIITQA